MAEAYACQLLDTCRANAAYGCREKMSRDNKNNYIYNINDYRKMRYNLYIDINMHDNI